MKRRSQGWRHSMHWVVGVPVMMLIGGWFGAQSVVRLWVRLHRGAPPTSNFARGGASASDAAQPPLEAANDDFGGDKTDGERHRGGGDHAADQEPGLGHNTSR